MMSVVRTTRTLPSAVRMVTVRRTHTSNRLEKNFSESLGDLLLCIRIFLPPRRQKIASPIFFTFSCIVKEEMGLLLRLKSNFYPSYISTSRSYYHYITNDIKCQDILSNMWCNILQRCLQCSEYARLVPLNQLNSCGNLRDTQLNRPSQGWDTQHWLKEAAEVS